MRRVGQPEAKQVSGETPQDMVGWRDGPRVHGVLVVGCPKSVAKTNAPALKRRAEGRSGHMSRYIRRRPLHAVAPRSELFTGGTGHGAAAQKEWLGRRRCRLQKSKT